MFDLGVRALDNGPDIAIDLCVSDCGTGKPPARYQTGAKGEAKGKLKRRRYLAAFPGLPEPELCFPSYGGTGTKDADAAGLHKRIIIALASANPTTPYSAIVNRVQILVSLAIQQSIAFNALEYRYTKLGAARRTVGSGAVEQQPQVAAAAAGFDDFEDDEPDSGPGEGDSEVGDVEMAPAQAPLAGAGGGAALQAAAEQGSPALGHQFDDVEMGPEQGLPAAHAGGETGAGEVHHLTGSPTSAQ
jgi:hypothetical protein